MTIVHGHAGVGKSGIAKTFLENTLLDNFHVFAFKGDELVGKSLDAVLSDKTGFNMPIEEFLNKDKLLGKKLFWIDSFEKLLENSEKEPFIDLLRLASNNDDIRLVVTIRSYALAQLRFSFLQYQPSKVEIIEVLPLSIDEQKTILTPFPFLKPLFDNPKIETLMRTPFYLNEAVSLKNSPLYEKPQELNEISLKEHLWQGTIEGAKHNFSLKQRKQRGDTFLAIAVKRAKALSLMIKLDNPDLDSIETLKRDSIIFTDNGDEYFAPAHDIFEDWALSKYVQKCFNNCPFAGQKFGLLKKNTKERTLPKKRGNERL